MKDHIIRNNNINSGFKGADTISIGEKAFVEDKEQKPSNSGENKIEFVRVGGTSFKTEKFENSDSGQFSFLSEKFLLIVSGLTFLVICYSMIKFVSTSYTNPLLSINSGAIFSFALFSSIIIFTIFFLYRRKTIRISLNNNFLNVKIFPGLEHKIPVSLVKQCSVDLFNQRNMSLKNRENKFQPREKVYRTSLENGLAVYLKNGKCLIYGSSRSHPSFNIPN